GSWLDCLHSWPKGERRFAPHPHPAHSPSGRTGVLPDALCATFSRREKGGGADRVATPSEVPFALFLFHRRGFVGVDEAALTLGRGGLAHFGDDVAERVGLRLDCAGQRIASEGAEAHPPHCRLFAGLERQPV